jgi:hypothetical protein
MVRPAAFRRNEVTSPTNRFQAANGDANESRTAAAAVREFDACVSVLRVHGIDVRVFPGRTTTTLPDEIFPNNWFSTHPDGTLVLYPLMAWNRREERRRDILEQLQKQAGGFRIGRVIDLSGLEESGAFLEGTGSLVLDHGEHLAYAALSARTQAPALREFAKRTGYGVLAFHTRDGHGQAVYHTNVMMSLGEEFALICPEVIPAVTDRLRVLTRLERSGREVIEFSVDQLDAFVGNLIQLRAGGKRIIALSRRALAALTVGQRRALARHGELVALDVDTIEVNGGGSVRCMLAELLLPPKSAPSRTLARD